MRAHGSRRLHVHDGACVCRSSCEESSALDGPACSVMAQVQTVVSGVWGGYASVSCFGSRATGLACATSDIDLVVTGVP